jgi:acetyl esterase/lipase
MLKTLVAIEVDLASSMAIRYACDLGNLIPTELYPVYVKAPPPEVPATGTGWVRHTWERQIVEMGTEEIQEMLASEQDSCPLLQAPRVIYGDREYELLKIVGQESFDLYVEGAPYPFNPVNIQRRLHSKFYQKLASPLIWLRVLRKIHLALVVCPDLVSARAVLPAFGKLWSGCSTPVHLALPPQEGYGGSGDALRDEARKALAAMEAAGGTVEVKEVADWSTGGPDPTMLKDYGLVAVALERAVKKDHVRLQWLAQVKNPLLLVLY